VVVGERLFNQNAHETKLDMTDAGYDLREQSSAARPLAGPSLTPARACALRAVYFVLLNLIRFVTVGIFYPFLSKSGADRPASARCRR
jgi:hypothetical protein